MAHGPRFRIVEIRTDLLPEMLDAGFDASIPQTHG
jgi:hypothetical protein